MNRMPISLEHRIRIGPEFRGGVGGAYFALFFFQLKTKVNADRLIPTKVFGTLIRDFHQPAVITHGTTIDGAQQRYS